MERQLFYILYEDKNDMQFKLIKSYVNCFIIDEDAECEVIEIIKIKPPEIEYLENSFFLEISRANLSQRIDNILKLVEKCGSIS